MVKVLFRLGVIERQKGLPTFDPRIRSAKALGLQPAHIFYRFRNRPYRYILGLETAVDNIWDTKGHS